MQWIEYGKSFREFDADGLCRPGVQIEYMEVGDRKITRELIGDIDYQGGVLRDTVDALCVEIILRYRVIASPDQLAAE